MHRSRAVSFFAEAADEEEAEAVGWSGTSAIFTVKNQKNV